MLMVRCTMDAPAFICIATQVAMQTEHTTMARKVSSLYDNFRRWRRYRTTVRELEQLSNRELNDLGIHRSQIHSVARQAAIF